MMLNRILVTPLVFGSIAIVGCDWIDCIDVTSVIPTPCLDCGPRESEYSCQFSYEECTSTGCTTRIFSESLCHDDYRSAEAYCAAQCGAVRGVTTGCPSEDLSIVPINCSSGNGDGCEATVHHCESWEPVAYIQPDPTGSGALFIDADAIDAIVQHIGVLACDDSYFYHDSTNGGWLAEGVDSGSLLDELGFQPGDRVHTINGVAVPDADAISGFYLHSLSDTEFAVEVDRPTGPVTLNFVISDNG